MSSSTIANRYEIRDIVGRGGMGIVYRAYDRIIGRDVALKTLVDIQGRAIVQLFYKEWRVLANLHHPNIVEIFDIGEFDDNGVIKPFFVMPLLSGVTLAQLLYTPGQEPSVERLAEIVSQICRGLQGIHDIGLVHRDLKPSNIFVMEFNSVKLIDFGVAHLVGGQTFTGLKGTASYMAPEQIQNQECTPASDLFALGVLCYEALTRLRPFRGADNEEIFEAILHHIPQPVYELNPAISQALSRVVHKALAKRPAHRYANALEFSDTFQKALRGEPITFFDPARIQPRIQRAVRAFEQGNYQMATDILGDLEAAGHIDPALAPLRRQIDEALRKKSIREMLDRASMAFGEEEYLLALQNVESALKIDPANEEAAQLKESVQQEIARREIEDSFESARACIEQFAFSRARQLMQKVLELRSGDPQATEMLAQIETRERAYRAALREKEELYRTAREAWQNYEFVAAIQKLERVLELEAKAPDTAAAVDSGANYADFLKLVESAQAAIDECQAQVNACMVRGQYERALELCTECNIKYPGHPLPQGVKLEIQARQKRETLQQMAAAGRAADDEPDLEKKLFLLRQAAEQFPGEPLFDQWSRPLRDLLALVNNIVTKARVHEEHGRFLEALECWHMLRAVNSSYPGLQKEIERISVLVVANPATSSAAQKMQMAARGPDPSFFTETGEADRTPDFMEEPMPEPPAVIAERVPVPKTPRLWAEAVRAGRAFSSNTAAALRRIPPMLARWWARAHLLAARMDRRILQVAVASLLFVLIAIGSGTLIYRRRHMPPPPEPAPRKVAVTIRAATPGAVIRVGDQIAPPGREARVELLPGRYPIQVTADGYQPYQDDLIVGPGSPVMTTIPELRPLPTPLHISGLERAKVRLDGHDPEDLGDEFLRDLAPGEHEIQVFSSASEAHFKFVTATGRAPEVQGTIAAKEVAAIVAGQMGGILNLSASFTPLKVTLDGNISPSQATNLSPGQHTIVASDGISPPYTLSVTAGPQTAIWVWLYSDRNVGTLRIAAGLDNFQVELDGKPQNKPIRGGEMVISNLAVRKYKVKVSADEFQPQETEVEITKRSDIRRELTLIPLAQTATLIVRGGLPHTHVLIDKLLAGTIDQSGNLEYDKVAPGSHAIELKNDPSYKPKYLTKSFVKRQTVQLTREELQLDFNPALVTLTVKPAEAKLEWRCGAALQTVLPRGAPCAENKVSWIASAKGYYDQSGSDNLTPGVPFSKEIVLPAEAAPLPVPQGKTCRNADLANAGWKLQKDWYSAQRQLLLPCDKHLGQFEFIVQLPKGALARLSAANVSWSINSGSKLSKFTLDRRTFSSPDKQPEPISDYEQDGGIKFRIIIGPSRVIHQIEASGSWKEVSSVDGSFGSAQISFAKGAMLKNFSFREQ